VSYTGSLVGSTDGAVTLSAGNDVHITGSDVLSQTGTAIVGKNVTIDAAVGSTDTDQKQTLHTGGIHVGISGGAVSAAQGVYGAAQGVSHSSDNRLKALYAMQAAQDLYSPGAARGMGLAGGNGMDAIGDAVSDPHLASGKGGNNSGSGINLQIGITASTARNEAKTHDDTTYGSHIKSAGDITIAATGGDLNVVGSQVQGRNVSLSAAHDLNLLSQAEQHTDTQTSSNASGGIGVSIGSSGFGVYVEASMGKGKAHGNGTTHTNTSVTAADTLSLIAGNDANIQGAQATGNTVLAGIGHNLNIASEQDTNDYASKQWQAGGQVMIGAGGGGSFNYSQSKAKSNYASVTQISGLAAGDGGFQIYVGGNTDLKGAVIASTADPSKNLLDTGTLSYSDIQNQASYSASSMSAGSGGGLMGAGLGLSGLATPQHDNSSSTTRAGVAQGTILVRNNPGQDLDGLDRNPDINAGGLKPIFDADKVAEQQELSRVAGQVLFTGANDLVSSRRDQAEQDLQNAKIAYEHATTDEERATAKQQFQDAQGRLSAWGDGGTGKTAVQVLAGALQAQVGGGNVGSAAAGVAGNEFVLSRVSAALNNNGVPVDSAAHGTAMSLTGAGLGWLAGNVVGGDGDSGAVGAATAQYYGYYDYRDGRRQVAQWQSGLSAGAADGNAHVQQAMAAAIDKAIQMGADPADVVAGLSVPGVANDMRGVVQADAVALGMYGQSYDALDTAQQQAVLQRMAVVVVGAQQDAGAAGSANPLILVVSPQASNTAAYGSVGGADGDLRAQVGGAASALIVSGETGVEKVVNWMGPSTAEGLGYVVMAATGGPMKTAGQILLDQSGATQWIQDQKDTYLINPLAGLVGQYGFDAQTQAQQQAVYPASHATASAGVNTLLSVVGAQTPNKGVKSIVGESEGFAEKVGQADQAIANDAEVAGRGALQESASGVASNGAGFNDLANIRKELGLPPAGSAADKSTLAVIEVNGEKIYGINAHGQPVKGVNAISSTHAEIDALNQIKQKGLDVRGQNLTLYVDRMPCAACGQNGGIRSMMQQLGLNQLTVIGPDGLMVITQR
jgi:filamentous hemagglutinin